MHITYHLDWMDAYLEPYTLYFSLFLHFVMFLLFNILIFSFSGKQQHAQDLQQEAIFEEKNPVPIERVALCGASLSKCTGIFMYNFLGRLVSVSENA